MATFPNGVQLFKWDQHEIPTAETVSLKMQNFGYTVYDLQTVPGWFHRSNHQHDEPEIRGAVEGVITFHFDEYPITIEGGDILLIPGGVSHEVIVHNPNSFSAFKGSLSGVRSVTELGDGKGSIEDLAQKMQSGED